MKDAKSEFQDMSFETPWVKITLSKIKDCFCVTVKERGRKKTYFASQREHDAVDRYCTYVNAETKRIIEGALL